MKQVSIIIPTYNSMDMLERTLASLCQQGMNREAFEVIVADDGSSDDTRHVTQAFADRLDITWCFQENLGFRVAAARNMGLALAQGEYVFFLDAGVVLKSDALQVQYAQREPNTFNIGFCYGFEEFAVTTDAFRHYLAAADFTGLFNALALDPSSRDCREKLLDRLGHHGGVDTYPWLFFWGGHLFGKTSDFRGIGGFDENFTSWGGEDVELGLRLARAGFSFKLVLASKAYHIPHPKAPAAGAEAAHDNCAYIHQKHQLPITERMLNETWDVIVASVSA